MDDPLSGLDLERWMREALAEADAAGRAGEYPIGAVVVLQGEIVGRGRSQQRERRTQLAHAELEALLDAGEAILEQHDEAVLFSTVEPAESTGDQTRDASKSLSWYKNDAMA